MEEALTDHPARASADVGVDAQAVSVEQQQAPGQWTDARCANCGSTRVTAFCSDCGQRAYRERFEIRRLAATAADELLRLDRGLLRTAADMTMRPGAMLNEYLAGRTRPYTDPLKYLFITVALATLTYSWTGIFGAFLLPGADSRGPNASQALVLDAFTRYFNIVLAFGVPFMAAGSRLVFRGAGLNTAEHMIVNLYAYGQICLLSIAMLPLFLLGGGAQLYVGLYSFAMMAYYVYVLRQFFGVGWMSATYRGSVIMGLAYAGYVAIAVLAVVVLRVTGVL